MGKKRSMSRAGFSAVAFGIAGVSLQFAFLWITDALSREVLDVGRLAVGFLSLLNSAGWFVSCYALKALDQQRTR
jgi:hypothetical protein